MLPAARRFLGLLVAITASTAVIAVPFGLLLGASVDRALTVGLYVVGAFLLIAGFFMGNRGPVRLRGDAMATYFGARFVRWASLSEQDEALNSSALFVVLGFALIVLGVALDSRYGLY